MAKKMAQDDMAQMRKVLGKRLSIERRRLGLTQAYVAIQVGGVTQGVSHWETGNAAPSMRSLWTLVRKLGYDPSFLFTGRRVDNHLEVA
jgi:transcriptional regulator with XRE-family HTH domain